MLRCDSWERQLWGWTGWVRSRWVLRAHASVSRSVLELLLGHCITFTKIKHVAHPFQQVVRNSPVLIPWCEFSKPVEAEPTQEMQTRFQLLTRKSGGMGGLQFPRPAFGKDSVLSALRASQLLSLAFPSGARSAQAAACYSPSCGGQTAGEGLPARSSGTRSTVQCALI